MKKILIAGGGLAGLAAAYDMTQAGCQVELFESRPVLGGKVSSWKDADGDWIESGLHVFFGCYEELFKLMRAVGADTYLRWKAPVCHFTLPEGVTYDIVSWRGLPFPLHLLPNLVTASQFSLGEKLAYGRALLPVLFGDSRYADAQDELSYADWHRQQGVGNNLLGGMLLPQTLALKFLPPEELSAQVVLNVFRLFLRRDDGFQVAFLEGSPEECLVQPLVQAITRAGGHVHTGRKVTRIELDAAGHVRGFVVDGTLHTGDAYLCALPVHQMNRLIPAAWRAQYPYFEHLRHFVGVPVMNVQLWLDGRLTERDNLLFGGAGLTPVYADMRLTTPRYAPASGNTLLEAVVAPARELMALSDAEVVAAVWERMKSYYPTVAPHLNIVKSSVVRIRQSVYHPKPGLERYRPTQASPVPNFFLAGGFTRGHRFFDSMEGAVASGRLAAKAMLAYVQTGRAAAA
ncbi:FAD-dependent oxidoreductase [Chloracidobacterium thermophilum]|uniref:FAD-dependent oxidoreductase n=1 Tax=Chloracidobacterium thermophilum TaxID=458033 RepID=UPI000738A7A8|nr:FAD-dependent oxidoreductase [Chloracidobacterium thermophilum]